MCKWLLTGLGMVLLLAGAATFWLPLPIGVPLILLGGTLLLRHSPRSRRWLVAAAYRFPALRGYLDRWLDRQSSGRAD